jgi:hypothetical protein
LPNPPSEGVDWLPPPHDLDNEAAEGGWSPASRRPAALHRRRRDPAAVADGRLASVVVECNTNVASPGRRAATRRFRFKLARPRHDQRDRSEDLDVRTVGKAGHPTIGGVLCAGDCFRVGLVLPRYLRAALLLPALVGAVVFTLNSAAASVLLGNQTVEAGHDSTGPGVAEAFQVTAAASGSLDKLTVYVDSTSTANALTVGIYADANGHPGSLLSEGTNSAPAKGAWNGVALSPADVTSGRSYWIALLSPLGAGVLQFSDVARSGTSQTSASAS